MSLSKKDVNSEYYQQAARATQAAFDAFWEHLGTRPNPATARHEDHVEENLIRIAIKARRRQDRMDRRNSDAGQ